MRATITSAEAILVDLPTWACRWPAARGPVRTTLPVLWTLASGDTARDIDESIR